MFTCERTKVGNDVMFPTLEQRSSRYCMWNASFQSTFLRYLHQNKDVSMFTGDLLYFKVGYVCYSIFIFVPGVLGLASKQTIRGWSIMAKYTSHMVCLMNTGPTRRHEQVSPNSYHFISLALYEMLCDLYSWLGSCVEDRFWKAIYNNLHLVAIRYVI